MPNLTDSYIRTLVQPKRGHAFHWDAKLTGFGVRVTAAGATAFVFRYIAGGRGGKERLWTIGAWGPSPLWSASGARKKAEELAAKLLTSGVGPFEDIAERRLRDEQLAARPDVARLCDDFLERHARPKKRPASVEGDESLIRRVIRPRIGARKVEEITTRDIEDIHHAMKNTPYQANRCVAVLSKMFTLAVKWRWRPDNPCRGIEKFQEERRNRWLDRKELADLGQALDAYSRANSRAVNAIRLLLLTGSRKQEALMAEWEHIDFERGVWTKPSAHTKQKRFEMVPLSAPALALLVEMKAAALPGQRFLFPGNKSTLGAETHMTELKRAWDTVCKMAGLKNARLHDLRHTYASHLVSGGLPLEIVGGLLGHTQVATTRRYAHLADSPLREATERFGRIVENARMEKSGEIVPLSPRRGRRKSA